MAETITIIQSGGKEKTQGNLIPLVPDNYDFVRDSREWGELVFPEDVPLEVLHAFEESFGHKLAPVPGEPYFQVLSCLGKEDTDLHQERGVVKISGIFRVSEKETPKKKSQSGWRIRCKPVFLEKGSLVYRLREIGTYPTDLREHGLFLTHQKIAGYKRRSRGEATLEATLRVYLY